jgi:hypothetical protein
MKTLAFDMPDLTSVENLMVERLNETTLKADSPVICINRGRKPRQVTYDGEHLTVPVGYFRTEYGAAQHMQKHLIVPGTRNAESGGFVSWVAILGSDDGRVAVDPAESCAPFDDDELNSFGESLEGLAREGRDPLVPVKTAAARAMSRSQGGSLRPQISATEQVSEAAREAAEVVFEPPVESETRQAEAAAAVERSAASVPAPRPMRSPARR